MKVAITVAVLIAVTLVSAGSPPVWPDQYYVKGTFNIPYFEIVEPIELNFDAKNNREAFSYYNEMDTYIWRFDTQTLYQIIPRIDTLMCFTSNGIGNGPMVTLLPDLSDWTYIGQKFKDNIKCDVFQKVVTNFNRTDTFKMYTTSAGGQPYELHINGYDFVFGSHPDIYIMKYEVFKPNWVNETAFNPPSLCNNAKPSTKNSMYRARSILARSGLVVPQKQSEDHFDHFVAKYKKVYHTEEEYQHRRGIYEKNLKYIKEHNERTDVTHTLGMNHYGDLTQDEVRAILYPKSAPGSRLAASSGADYIHKSSGRQVPSSIDWRTLGAVNPPKDQGVCGSCWTFGTTGAIEGAWFVKTGNLVSLSEQQIVDCAWGTWIQGNSGCDGGFAGPAFEWIMQNNGIALEQTYKYLMMDHYCNAYDVSSGVTLKGYVNVTSGSEDDLVDALASVGPVTVAIDASHPSFTYYLSGVYYEPECKNDIDDLDHQVLAVGYGSENGQDYWIVKNSWSTHWGDQGFVKMARNRNNNCGVATQAQYVLV